MRAYTEDLESAAQRAQAPELQDLCNENSSWMDHIWHWLNSEWNRTAAKKQCWQELKVLPWSFCRASFLKGRAVHRSRQSFSLLCQDQRWPVHGAVCTPEWLQTEIMLLLPAFWTAADRFDMGLFVLFYLWSLCGRLKTKTWCPKKCISTHDLPDLWVSCHEMMSYCC